MPWRDVRPSVVGHPLLGVREALKVLVGVSSGHSPHRYDFSMPTAARRSTGARESRKRGHDEEPVRGPNLDPRHGSQFDERPRVPSVR